MNLNEFYNCLFLFGVELADLLDFLFLYFLFGSMISLTIGVDWIARVFVRSEKRVQEFNRLFQLSSYH